MPALDDVARIALALPEAVEVDRHGSRTWAVAGRTFAWERTFSKADLRRFGDATVPPDPILAVRAMDLEDTSALLAQGMRGVFTIPHFDGFAAVLVELRRVSARNLRELVEDGWRACAPPRVVRERPK